MKKMFLCFGFVILILVCFKVFKLGKLDAVDREFREYIKENYDYELASKSMVGRCATECDYYGYYPLKDDMTYAIQISKTNGEIKVSCNDTAIKMRRELYDYIASQKGSNYVENFLQFYDNGDQGHIHYLSMSIHELEYIVYYDGNMDMDKQIYSDYLILKKAIEIKEKATESGKIDRMAVYYIADKRLKKNNWLEKLRIDFDDYGFAPSYLDGDKELNTMKYTYYYNIANIKDKIELNDLSFEEFEILVKENLEHK